MVRCGQVREAVSARLDGEDPGLLPRTVEAHLRSCPDCRGHARRAAAINRQLRLQPVADGAGTDHTPEILAAIRRERDPVRSPTPGAEVATRVGLLGLALLQLAHALPGLLSAADGAASHSLRELGSFQVAVAVGFAAAAITPARALGLLPVTAALASCLVLVTAVDLLSGTVVAIGELIHLAEAGGVALLWHLTRRDRAYGDRQPA